MPRFFWAYDFTKAVAFMQAGGWFLRGHVLTIGPLGFAVQWKTKKPKDAGKEAGR